MRSVGHYEKIIGLSKSHIQFKKSGGGQRKKEVVRTGKKRVDPKGYYQGVKRIPLKGERRRRQKHIATKG